MAIVQRLARLALLGVGCLSALVATAPARAEQAAWDQGRVTALGQELFHAADAFQTAVLQQPEGEVVGSGDSQQEFGINYKARTLREMSEGLAGHLSKGDGYDKTKDQYRDIKELMDDIEVLMQQSENDEPTTAAWQKLVDAQGQIAPYYGSKEVSE